VVTGRVGKADEEQDEELEVFPEVKSSSEWELKRVAMGAWKRRRLVIDSMVMGGKARGWGDCWSVRGLGMSRAD
jgi:hypothetical protein